MKSNKIIASLVFLLLFSIVAAADDLPDGSDLTPNRPFTNYFNDQCKGRYGYAECGEWYAANLRYKAGVDAANFQQQQRIAELEAEGIRQAIDIPGLVVNREKGEMIGDYAAHNYEAFNDMVEAGVPAEDAVSFGKDAVFISAAATIGEVMQRAILLTSGQTAGLGLKGAIGVAGLEAAGGAASVATDIAYSSVTGAEVTVGGALADITPVVAGGKALSGAIGTALARSGKAPGLAEAFQRVAFSASEAGAELIEGASTVASKNAGRWTLKGAIRLAKPAIKAGEEGAVNAAGKALIRNTDTGEEIEVYLTEAEITEVERVQQAISTEQIQREIYNGLPENAPQGEATLQQQEINDYYNRVAAMEESARLQQEEAVAITVPSEFEGWASTTNPPPSARSLAVNELPLGGDSRTRADGRTQITYQVNGEDFTVLVDNDGNIFWDDSGFEVPISREELASTVDTTPARAVSYNVGTEMEGPEGSSCAQR